MAIFMDILWEIWSKLSLPFTVQPNTYFTHTDFHARKNVGEGSGSDDTAVTVHIRSTRTEYLREISFWLFLALPIRCTQGRHFENANFNSNENTLFILRTCTHRHTNTKWLLHSNRSLARCWQFSVSFSFSIDLASRFGIHCCWYILLAFTISWIYKIASHLAMFLAPFFSIQRMLQQTKWKNVMLLLFCVCCFFLSLVANANKKNKNYKTISWD